MTWYTAWKILMDRLSQIGLAAGDVDWSKYPTGDQIGQMAGAHREVFAQFQYLKIAELGVSQLLALWQLLDLAFDAGAAAGRQEIGRNLRLLIGASEEVAK